MSTRSLFAIILLVGAAGCRTAAHRTEMPRVDLELNGSGNRGYLLGTAPAAGEQKTSREMIRADIEIPTLYKAKPTGTPVDLGEPMAADSSVPAAAADERPAPAATGTFDTYVVKPGDSLWTIAAKPEVYGHATHWRRIFDANRDLLKSPDQVKAGMTLKIPRGDDGGMTFGDGSGYQKK